MKLKAIALTMVLLSTSAYAQIKAGDYLCKADWSGGGKYSAVEKRWTGTQFNPDTQFMLKLEFVLKDKYQETLSPIFQTDYYNIIIGDVNFPDGRYCLSSEGDRDVRSSLSSLIECNLSLFGEEYQFNLDNARYTKVSRVGFIDGEDDQTASTPHIEGGTCTKIE
jgi:hypothetical protein